MPARRRTTFPGLQPQAVKELIGLQVDLAQDTLNLREETVGITTDTKTSGTAAAKYNQRIRCSPTAAGVDLVFPGAAPVNQNKWIEVLVLKAGNVRIRATSGLVQSTTLFTLTTVGYYFFQSDGIVGWWTVPPSAGGGLTDGVYGSITVSGGGTILQVTDGVYGDVTVTAGGTIWTVAAAPASVTMVDASITLAYTGRHTGAVVIAAAGVAAGSHVGIFWGTVTEADENTPEMDDVTFTATPLAGFLIVRVSSDKAPVGGTYKFRYLIG